MQGLTDSSFSAGLFSFIMGITILEFLVVAVLSYLLGSFNSAIVICKVTLGKDIRQYGSGSAGLTNALRTMGKGKTVLVLIGDCLKAAIAMYIGGALLGPVGKLFAGIFVILGHVFPLYFGFRGGKGVLVGAVMLAFFDWRVFLIALGFFLVAVALTRWVSLGSILGAVSFPITTHLFYGDAVMSLMALGMAAAVIYMHRSNIGRILAGTENRLSFRGSPQIKVDAPDEGEQS